GMSLDERLAGGQVIILDGATGTELERRGVPMDDVSWSGIASLSHPATLRQIHVDYIAAGAEVVITNTFAASRYLLEAAGLAEQVRAANEAAVALAREARDRAAGRREVWIAGSISPMAPAAERGRRPDLATVAASFREQAEILARAGVDLLLLEMMRDVDHAGAAIDAAVATGLPVWVGFSCALRAEGEVIMAPGIVDDLPLERVVEPVMARGGSLVAIMHSEIEVTRPALAVARRQWRGPLGAYAHSGRFVMPHWQFDDIISPAAYLAEAERWVADGVQVVGGCCGIGPDHVRLLAERLPRTVPRRDGPVPPGSGPC
ncbi:MAG TPA: homocysteine S-methyltransferase family protein, partial [Geminicoccaceae bacterium]|nr:homocysteine S-methyltransferase family protein [Geminicoccaceae bacterium]